MKPYLIKTKVQQFWIDLDHVAVIYEPKFIDHMGHGGYFVRMDIQMFFMDDTFSIMLEQEGLFDYETKKYIGPVLSHGIPSELEYMLKEVYTPLVEAWKNKDMNNAIS